MRPGRNTGPWHVVSRTEIRFAPITPNRPGEFMKLYEFAPTRTIRVRWTLQELAVDMATTAKVLNGLPRLEAYLEEMYARPRAPMRIAAAFASIRR